MAIDPQAIRKILQTVGPYLPQALALIQANPEIWEAVKKQAAQLAKPKGSPLDDVLATIEVLRDQVAYLDQSADDAEETRQAQAWAKRLDSCEHAAQVLKSPGSTKEQLAALKAQVDALRAEIFSAFIREQSEDAQAGETPSP